MLFLQIILTIILVIMILRLLAGYLFRRFFRKLQSNFDASQTPPPGQKTMGKMVKCDYCDVYLPIEEAISKGQHYYCSTAHLQHHDKQ